MRGACFAVIEFGMLHARARTHALHVAGHDVGTGAHGILVAQCAIKHVADDFHVAVAMFAEATTCRHAILVDHAQRSPMHVLVIVVTGEGKAVPGIQPAVVGMATFAGRSQGDHLVLLNLWSAQNDRITYVDKDCLHSLFVPYMELYRIQLQACPTPATQFAAVASFGTYRSQPPASAL